MKCVKSKLPLLVELSQSLAKNVDIGKYIDGITKKGIITNEIMKKIFIKGMYFVLDKISNDNIVKSIEYVNIMYYQLTICFMYQK